MTQATDPGFEPALLEAPGDAALAAIERAGAKAERLVEQWIKRGNAAAVVEVAERGAGPARKAARRGINVLKSRGIRLPERSKSSAVAPSRQPETLEAWMMPPDTNGHLMMVVAARSPASRYRAAFVLMHDSLGVQRVESTEVSQSGLKQTLAGILPGAAYKPVKVPVKWARARVAEARKRHAERGVPEPLGFAAAKALLEPVPDPLPAHPFDEEGLELAPEDAKELAKQSATLHRLPELRAWMPSKAAVDELLAKLGETITPGEQPDQEKLGESLQAEIGAATDRYFSPQLRAELVRSLKDSALSVLAREGEQRALEISATIQAIESCGLITDPPHEVPFLRGFFEKAVAMLLAQSGGSLNLPVSRRPEQT
jgi:uncharacterized protein with PIN domain